MRTNVRTGMAPAGNVSRWRTVAFHMGQPGVTPGKPKMVLLCCVKPGSGRGNVVSPLWDSSAGSPHPGQPPPGGLGRWPVAHLPGQSSHLADHQGHESHPEWPLHPLTGVGKCSLAFSEPLVTGTDQYILLLFQILIKTL